MNLQVLYKPSSICVKNAPSGVNYE